MKIAIGSDHAGHHYRVALIGHLESQGFSIIDMGPPSADSVDYPDFVHPVAEALEQGDADVGIVLCGSGNGVAMTANKHSHVRAALCWNMEIAKLAREHNDANIIAIPARYVSEDLATRMVDVFLNTPFEGGRHQRRVDKISC
jgi:ribose 5-phosphate isomerase B